MMYENIIVGYDDSDYSKAALKEAVNWTKRHGGKVVLVHGVYFEQEEFAVAPDQIEKRFEMGTKVCYQAKEMASSEYGIELESLVCQGEPPDVILDIARSKGADLIALGTHGRKGLKRLLMGSVTSKVTVEAPCDVLVVKRPCNDCGGPYRCILVPFDGSKYGVKALEKACELSKLDGASVTVLYVVPRYEEMMEFMMTSSIRKSLAAEAQKILDKAREVASRHGVEITTEVSDGQAAEEAVKAAVSHKCDMIVMGSHGWTGVNKAIMGSTTERVIITAKCPVLLTR